MTVTLDDVRAAAERIAGAVERTPSARSQTLSAVLGTDIVVKFENLQFTAAFKERGALNKLLVAHRRPSGACGVVAMSAGNHAQAVARHATRLGIDATIVMPAATPFVKVHRTEVLGARVVLPRRRPRRSHRRGPAHRRGRGPRVRAPLRRPGRRRRPGHGGARAARRTTPSLDALLVPTGGGGLLAGMAVVARALRPEMTIIGAQSDRWPSMLAATTGQDLEVGGPTIAEGIAVPVAGALTTRLISQHVDRIVTVRGRVGSRRPSTSSSRSRRWWWRAPARPGSRPCSSTPTCSPIVTWAWCSAAATWTLGCSPPSSCAASCAQAA